MMAKLYKKRVVNMKNGYGRDMHIILEEKNGQTSLICKEEKGTDVYIYTNDEKYEKGQAEKDRYTFKNIELENIRAVIMGGFDNNGYVEKTSFTGFLKNECLLKPFVCREEVKAEEKAEAKTEAKAEEKTERKNEEAANKNNKYDHVKKEYEIMKNGFSAVENFRKIIDAFAKGMNELEETKLLNKEEITYIETGKIKTTDDATNRLFEESMPLTPFAESAYDWAMVSMEDMWKTDIKKCSCVLNDMVMLAEIKYHHLALGRNKEDGSFVFAVPEKFNAADKKHAGELGFKDFWFCSRENSPFGYWVMDI